MPNNDINTIYESIRGKILTESYRSGHKLSENTLAEEYGCSRTPIREIFQRLANDGLVVIKPKSGTYVRHETKKEYVELMQVRAYLEALAFHLCIHKITERELKQLEKIKKDMDLLVEVIPINMMKYAKLHYKFHHHIIRSSKNDLLLNNFERLNLKTSYLFYQVMDESTGRISQDEHQLIITYLKDRDERGINYMKEHMFQKLERMFGKAF